MKEVDREEIKSFDELRARVRRLIEQHEGPLPRKEFDTVREFLTKVDLPEKQTTGDE